jgi:hypothetical protein
MRGSRSFKHNSVSWRRGSDSSGQGGIFYCLNQSLNLKNANPLYAAVHAARHTPKSRSEPYTGVPRHGKERSVVPGALLRSRVRKRFFGE